MGLSEKQIARLRKYRDAITEKSDWALKILDPEKGLAWKWAEEAGLLKNLKPIDSKNQDDRRLTREDIQETIDELKRVARRVRALDYTVHLHSPQIPARTIDWQKIDQDILGMLKYANISKWGVRTANLRIKPSIGIYVSDGLVPKSLHTELVNTLDGLAAMEPKDFHPGTNGRVQDLIHPSLYPYTAGVTKLAPEVRSSMFDNGDYFYTEMASNAENPAEDEFHSKQSWIPSIFTVNEDATDVHIEGYINGIGQREFFPDLYRLVEKVFVLCLPHFGKTLDDAMDFEDAEMTPSETRWEARSDARSDSSMSKEAWAQIIQNSHDERAREDQEYREQVQKAKEAAVHEWNHYASGNELESNKNASDSYCNRFKGKKMKVIVKAANYILKPGQEYEGAWHIEGMPHERVIASAIYYYSTDPSLSDGGLGIRRFRNGNGFPNEMDNHTDEFWVARKRGKKNKDQSEDQSEDKNEDDNEDGSEGEKHESEDDNESGNGDGNEDESEDDNGDESEDENGDESEDENEDDSEDENEDENEDDGEDENEDDSEDENEDDWDERDYPSDWEQDEHGYLNLRMNIPVGTVPTTNSDDIVPTGHQTGRILSFPNFVQHKVLKLKNEGTETAVRKILCFFLVEDDENNLKLNDDGDIEWPGFSYLHLAGRKVLTTSDIPIQAQQTTFPTMRVLLARGSKRLVGRALPNELINLIFEFADLGVSAAQAECLRRQFMDERSAPKKEHAGDSNIWEDEYSLCEH